MILLASVALADDAARVWESLYDARLVEAADGTPDVAVLYYEEAAQDIKPEDPLYGETWYWLGRTRYVLGQREDAVHALQTAAQDPQVRPQAMAMLSRIELEARAVRSLPATQGFEQNTGPFVRAWEDVEKGQLAARTVQGRALLAWDTTVKAGEADHVLAALLADQAFGGLRFEVRAHAFPVELRVTLADGAGGRFSAPVIQVPTGQWMEVDLPAKAFRSTDGGRSEQGSVLQSSDRVRVIELEDLTGLLSPDRGENTLYIDTVEIR